MEFKEILDLIRDEAQTYQDVEAPERMALARLVTRFEKRFEEEKHG